jgi:hypothetical protein
MRKERLMGKQNKQVRAQAEVGGGQEERGGEAEVRKTWCFACFRCVTRPVFFFRFLFFFSLVHEQDSEAYLVEEELSLYFDLSKA